MYVSSTTIRCLSPVNAVGNVMVEVSLNGVDFTGDGHTFTYTLPLQIVDFIPTVGSIYGGEDIMVTLNQLYS